MANQVGRPIAPARKLVALVMGTIAAFLTVFGIGMASWAVVVFGVALLALSIALGMVNVVRRGARAWVAGSAEVKAISPPPTSSSAVYGRAEIQAVIVAPGLPTSEVTIRDPRVPVAKWPGPGDTLPITVDVDDMRRVRINWDEAGGRPTGEDPPPPAPPSSRPDYGDPEDRLDDDLLGDVPTPPWQSRPDDWDRPPTAYDDADVVVHDTPDGRIVEGELVDRDDDLPPLPRRAPRREPTPTDPDLADPDADLADADLADADLADADLADQAGAAPFDEAPAPNSPAGAGPMASSTAASGPAAAAWAESNAASSTGGGSEPYRSAPGPSPAAAGAGPTSPSATAPTSPSGPRSSGFGPAAAATAGFVAVAAATRTSGPRPSPRPRPRPHGTATATVEPETTAPPTQRSPHLDDAFLTDIPLDDPLPPQPDPADRRTAPSPRTAAESAPMPPTPPAAEDLADQMGAGTVRAGTGTTQADATPEQAARASSSPWRRPRPTRTAAAPSPVSSFPTAPPPMTAPPTAPEPTTGRPTAPTPIDDIDVPLDADPDIAPESTPEAAESRAEDLIAPAPEAASAPAAGADFPYDPVLSLTPEPTFNEPSPSAVSTTPAAYEPPRTPEPAAAPATPAASSTRFTTNAAHESTVPTESFPTQPEQPKHGAGAVVAGAAAAMGAAVAAVKRLGRPHEHSLPTTDPTTNPEPYSSNPTPPPPVATPAAHRAPEPAVATGSAPVPSRQTAAAEDPTRGLGVPPTRSARSARSTPEPAEPGTPSTVDPASPVGPPTTQRPASSSPWVAEPFSVTEPESAAEPTEPAGPTSLASGPALSTTAGAPDSSAAEVPGSSAAGAPHSSRAEAPDGSAAGAPGGSAAAIPVGSAAGAATGSAAAAAAGAAAAAARAATAGAAGASAGVEARPEGSPWADLTQSTVPDEHADDLITAYPSARPGPAGAIHGVGITILVTDLDRSVAFYRDMLGFFVIDSGTGSAVLASGDTRLVLRTVDGLSAEAGRLIYLNLEVGDVEAVYEDLRAKGVRFVHEPRAVNRGERLELWSATFEDPDGHNVAITQWRATR